MQSRRSTRPAWTAVALVFLFMLINFADKAVIGLSSGQIMREMGLTHTQFGLLGSAFFLLFSLSGVVGGFLANRIRTKTLMLAMGLLWSAALLPMIRVSSFAVLATSRVVLGAAEGPAFPVAMHAVYKWFGNERRALPSSIVASGAAFGAGIVAPLVTWIIDHHGWHAAFGALGLAGLLWVALWTFLGREGPGDQGADAATPWSTENPRSIPYRRLLLSQTAVGVYLAGFAAYWIIALNLVWLANYLTKVLHMSPANAAWVITLPSIMQMIFAPSLAFASQRLSAAGVPSRISRGWLGTLCVIIGGISMLCLPFVPPGAWKILVVGLSFSIGSVIFTLGPTLIGEITPASQRGAMLGVANSVHTLAGLCAPFVMGRIVDINVDPIEGFRMGFVYAGTFVVALGLWAAIMINPERDLRRFHSLADAS
jgi:ACS family D-galactonate transporter-like MFS transporter